MGIPINNWREALNAKKDLIKDAEMVQTGKKEETTFQTVIVDTADIAYDYCEKFVLDKEGVEYLDETESKRGYRAVSLEYDRFFQDIVKAGYTLICISHATSKQVKEAGEKYDKTIPTIQGRGFLVISRLVDVCAYSCYETDEDGHTSSMLIMRGNKYLEAGSRNEFMSEKIPFTYEALRDDMAEAVMKLEKKYKVKATDTENNLFKKNKTKFDEFGFNEVFNKIKEYAVALHNLGRSDEYTQIVNTYLGRNRSVKDCDATQFDMLLLILDDLQDLEDVDGVEPLNASDSSEKKSKKSESSKKATKAKKSEEDEDSSDDEVEDEDTDEEEEKAPKKTSRKLGKSRKTEDEDELEELPDDDDGELDDLD